MNIEESIETKQLHDQLVPDKTQFEDGFDQVNYMCKTDNISVWEFII